MTYAGAHGSGAALGASPLSPGIALSRSHALTLSPGVVLGSGGRCAAAAAAAVAAAAASSAAAAFGEKGVRLAQKGASWRMHSRGVAAARGWSWPNV